MKPLALATLAKMAGGSLVQGAPELELRAVTTDSRVVPEGALFVALEGGRFDGHAFAGPSVAAGARAVLVSAARADAVRAVVPGHVGIIAVSDTLAALQALAAAYRNLLNPRVIAITGSNGKTSTKDFTRAVLASSYATHATEGNLNNHIGLPLTILRHEPGQTHGVYELGMNHPGEIAALGRIAQPDVAVITTLGTAHIEFFGSPEAIAEEKLSLFGCLRPGGVGVINFESPRATLAMERAPSKIITVGIDKGDVRATNLVAEADGHIRFTASAAGESAEVLLPVPGEHMVQNALLAMAVGVLEGIPLQQAALALGGGKLTKGRLQVKGWRGVTIIDDSYNANPDSMTAALKTLATQPSNARRIAVLGAMGELGPFSDEGHAMVGRVAAGPGIDMVCTVGDAAERIALAAGPKARHFADHATCARWLAGELQTGDVVLLKGSRSATMEKVLQALEGGDRA